MTTQQKIATYLRAIQNTTSLHEAQTEASMALKLIKKDEEKVKAKKRGNK